MHDDCLRCLLAGLRMADLEALREVYQLELQAAGDNAKEKIRIEEMYFPTLSPLLSPK